METGRIELTTTVTVKEIEDYIDMSKKRLEIETGKGISDWHQGQLWALNKVKEFIATGLPF
jgi:hypothetical protein